MKNWENQVSTLAESEARLEASQDQSQQSGHEGQARLEVGTQVRNHS